MNNRFLTSIAASLLSLFMVGASFAQDEHKPVEIKQKIKFDRLSVADGLPSSHVAGVKTGPNGFLWITTAGGLSRYDGKNIKNFIHDPDNPETLGGRLADPFAFDEQGFLWVSLLGGPIDRFDPKSETVTPPAATERSTPPSSSSLRFLFSSSCFFRSMPRTSASICLFTLS